MRHNPTWHLPCGVASTGGFPRRVTSWREALRQRGHACRFYNKDAVALLEDVARKRPATWILKGRKAPNSRGLSIISPIRPQFLPSLHHALLRSCKADRKMSTYDSIGLSVLSPVTSPRTRENDYYYTLVFPNTRALADECSSSSSSPVFVDESHRISYRDAVMLLRSVTPGGKEREKQAIDEFKRAWIEKFRATTPLPQDTIPFLYFQELLREVIIQRFDAIADLFFKTLTSEDGTLLLLSFRPSKALLASMADKSQLKVAMMAEIDPGEAYWALDPTRSQRESVQWSKPDGQEELYRMFLAGKVPMEEAQIFEQEHDREDAAMWSRRIHALKRLSDPEITKLVSQKPPPTMHLPYKNRASLQYLYRQIDSASSDSFSSGSPFRVVDKIRLTKAIIDAEFDCDSLVEKQVLVHHMCSHTHHTDAIDTSIDVLRFQWGSLLSPFRLYRQRLTGISQMFYFQPIMHVRNYFGEELALCT